MIDINGKWKILFKIEQSSLEELNNKEFTFDINIETNDGEIIGKSYENINNKIIESDISGFFENPIISFTKEYNPYFFSQDQIINNNNDNPEMEFTG